MKTLLKFFFFIFATSEIAGQIHVTGFVSDDVTGERLIGVNIIAGTVGTTSDNNGYFSLRTKAAATIKASHLGYNPVELTVEKDCLIEIRMSPGGIELPELVVTAEHRQNMNVASLTTKELLNIPALGGKPDVLKAAHLLPGINPLNEGSSLISVRGGNPGENLYLLDNIPLIYVNHIGGFMSVFNPDMINGLDIYKGGFPPMYGGKLSSIVDITQREGNMDGLKGTFSAGVTDLSFSVEGPTKIKNTSFIVTGRKTFTEAWFGLASKAFNDYIMVYGFHDINAKFTWKPNARNSLHLNLYQGDDYLHFRAQEKARLTTIWGNWLLSARWNYILNNKLFIKNSLSYTRYRLADRVRYDNTDGVYSSNYLSSVKDLSLRTDWKYHVLNNWAIDFGAQSSLLTHLPNSTHQTNFITQPIAEKYRNLETSVYLDNRITASKYITAHIGGRSVFYTNDGYNNITFEPRLRLDINISQNHIINISYMTAGQNSHLLFTSGGIMNNEVWIPSSGRFPVSGSEQYTAGWSGAFCAGMFQFGVEAYYKRLHNLSNYKEGYASLMGDTDWQSKIITGGSGEAKGVEFLLRKITGQWTGFASWSLSKATRKYPDINNGASYIYEFDRPHTVSLSVNRQLNSKFAFNAAWVFMTGLPYTPAIGRQLYSYIDENKYIDALIYGERNSARMKPYHRLDAGFNYTKLNKRNRKVVWTFSIYNVYNRHNPYFYYYAPDADENSAFSYYYTYNQRPFFYEQKSNQKLSLYQVSFFPIIPTVSYKVFF